ncbi:uncharacterized protein T551_01865 [Pneumocystis jirovecii RU7]|uniref:Uncharacterized protein n=1 Tax=Pneumocystis jirovecii (strain RU7) TaxID=1408657 RepID=A0A0W4ZNH6_PNEJ7|nr:uncharacterized protein T551_01865 [Pneumocystis jirovecii RU7]KTW29921.1 hypothetical protein T551_01865 [Pneumocystis jirovecii RU7]
MILCVYLLCGHIMYLYILLYHIQKINIGIELKDCIVNFIFIIIFSMNNIENFFKDLLNRYKYFRKWYYGRVGPRREI